MNRLTFKIVALILSLVLFAGIAVGCAPQDPVSSGTSGTDSSQAVSSDAGETPEQNADPSSDVLSESATHVLSPEDTDNFSEYDYGADVVYLYVNETKYQYHSDYKLEDFPEVECSMISWSQDSKGNVVILCLKYPGRKQVWEAIEILKKRSDVVDATPEYDSVLKPCEITDEHNFYDNMVVASLQPSARLHEYTIEDFPELEIVSVEKREAGHSRYLMMQLANPSRENVIAAVRLLEKREDFRAVNPSWLVSMDAQTDGVLDVNPNDTEYQESMLWGINAIRSTLAWDYTTGSSSVTVGIIDTGIDASHPDLAGRVSTTLSRCFVGTGYSATVDGNGHGTHVAGIVGAIGNNNMGVTGVCWNVTLVSLRASVVNNSDGTGSMDHYATIEAIKYATQNGIDVLNLSASGYQYDEEMQAAINSFPGVFVCSAGNSNLDLDSTIRYPASYQTSRMIVVGAMMPNYTKWSSSNHGTTIVDLFAPGVSIYSCYPGSEYRYMSGTSMATPFVAGAAALVLSQAPNMSGASVKAAIEDNVTTHTNLSGYCESGGYLNLYNTILDTHPCNYTINDPEYHSLSCQCGNAIYYHDYTYEYGFYDDLYHEACCDCGAGTLEAHNYVQDGNSYYCTDCYWTIAVNRSLPVLEIQ